MKTLHYLILGIVLLFAITACGGRESQTESESTNTYVPKYDRLVRGNIDKVRTMPWDKSYYMEVRDHQIPKMKGSKKQLECLKLLKFNACLAMEKDLKGLMDGQCSQSNYRNNHKRMDALYAELTGKEFKDVVTGDSLHVRSDYKTHQKLCTQVGKQYAPVKVSNFDDRYDLHYDESVARESREMYNKNRPVADRCHYLKTGLNNVSFQGRHKKYCDEVVTRYEELSSWSVGNENIILTRIGTFEKEFRNKPEWKDWNDRITAVKDKFAQ